MMALQLILFIIFVSIAVWRVDSLDDKPIDYRVSISKYDEKALANERFSFNGSNDSATEVVNHVRHKHEQTIGNYHIVTNIDIANTITILNSSVPTTSQSSNATVLTLLLPGKFSKFSKFKEWTTAAHSI